MIGAILSYTEGAAGEAGTIAWDFESVTALAVTTIAAVIGAVAIPYLAKWGWRVLVRFMGRA